MIEKRRLEAIRDWNDPKYSTGVHVMPHEVIEMARELVAYRKREAKAGEGLKTTGERRAYMKEAPNNFGPLTIQMLVDDIFTLLARSAAQAGENEALKRQLAEANADYAELKPIYDALVKDYSDASVAMEQLQQRVKVLEEALQRIRDIGRITFSKAASKGNVLAGRLAADITGKAEAALAPQPAQPSTKEPK